MARRKVCMINYETSTIGLNQTLLKALKDRADKLELGIEAFVEDSIEKQYLWPFFSKKHIRNYYYLQSRALNKDYSKARQVLFYILSYDGIYMEFIEDIYKIQGNKEVVNIPKDLNDILHPGFCLIDAACDFFQKGLIKNMENSFKWFKYDNKEIAITLNAVMLMRDVLKIDESMYLPEMFNIDLDEELKKEYSMDEYIDSKIFEYYTPKMRLLIKELFTKLKENDMVVTVKPSDMDECTFSLIMENRKRLALISSSDDGTNLRIGINKWKDGTHGNMLYCYKEEDMAVAVRDEDVPDSDLITKYKELL
jgi:hypothetical protein